MRVVGLGRLDRGDDAAGRLAARRAGRLLTGAVEVVEIHGELSELLECWRGTEAAILVDAVRGGAAPGTLLRLDPRCDRIPHCSEGSPRGLGLHEAIELARELDRLPATLVLHGIEGQCFDAGAPPSAPVLERLDELAARIAEEARALLGQPQPLAT